MRVNSMLYNSLNRINLLSESSTSPLSNLEYAAWLIDSHRATRFWVNPLSSLSNLKRLQMLSVLCTAIFYTLSVYILLNYK
jgi:hypothetical protein